MSIPLKTSEILITHNYLYLEIFIIGSIELNSGFQFSSIRRGSEFLPLFPDNGNPIQIKESSITIGRQTHGHEEKKKEKRVVTSQLEPTFVEIIIQGRFQILFNENQVVYKGKVVSNRTNYSRTASSVVLVDTNSPFPLFVNRYVSGST